MLDAHDKYSEIVAKYVLENNSALEFLTRHNKARHDLFPGVFSDPSWDLLLNIHLAEREGRRLSVSEACRTSSLVATVALRAIANLSERGVILRITDDKEPKRIYLRLSNETRQKLTRWLDELTRFFQKSGAAVLHGPMAND